MYELPPPPPQMTLLLVTVNYQNKTSKCGIKISAGNLRDNYYNSIIVQTTEHNRSVITRRLRIRILDVVLELLGSLLGSIRDISIHVYIYNIFIVIYELRAPVPPIQLSRSDYII